MKILFFLLIQILEGFSPTRTIFQCSRYEGVEKQCLNKWTDVYGNIRMDLWRCPLNQFCQIFNEKNSDNSDKGFCIKIFKKLYDGDSCSLHSECTSFNCVEGVCEGFNEGNYCQQGMFQCKNNLICRRKMEYLPYKEEKDIFQCLPLFQKDEICENDYECEKKFICDNKKMSIFIDNLNSRNISNLKDKIQFNKYIELKNGNNICVQRAIYSNGIFVTNPQSCQSGDSIEVEIYPNYKEQICATKNRIIQDCNEKYICTIEVNLGKYGDKIIEQKCLFTAMGNPICPLNQKELAWKTYLEKYDYYNKDKVINPYYKSTLNEYEVSKAYWMYTDWENSIEADICAEEFFFLRNKGYFLNSPLFFCLMSILLLNM